MGEVCLKIEPLSSLKPIDLTKFGTLEHIYIRSFVSKLSAKIATTMSSSAHEKLKSLYPNIKIDVESFVVPDHESVGAGTGLLIMAQTSTGCILASSELGKRGVTSESIAEETVDRLRQEIDNENCVDEYMQDQLILFMALADGVSRIRCGELTLHTKTAIHFCQVLTGAKFSVNSEGKNFIIECQGIGFKN
jgi:RNA 3'-terminal phosphate cyclase (ATP)